VGALNNDRAGTRLAPTNAFTGIGVYVIIKIQNKEVYLGGLYY
jgi:hypothetical protein